MGAKIKKLPLILFLAALSPSAHSADGDVDDSKAANICESAKNVPGVKAMRTEAGAVYQKVQTALAKVQDFRAACNNFTKNTKQTGPGLDALKTARDGANTSVQDYKSSLATLKSGTFKNISDAMKLLKHSQCYNDIASHSDFLDKQADKTLADRMKGACQSGDVSAQAATDASTITGKTDPADASAKSVSDTLTNPGPNKKGSASDQLLQQAADYAKANNLPSPVANANDHTCGAACAALLRAQAIGNDPNQGVYSVNYFNAMDAAKSTHTNKYGIRY